MSQPGPLATGSPPYHSDGLVLPHLLSLDHGICNYPVNPQLAYCEFLRDKGFRRGKFLWVGVKMYFHLANHNLCKVDVFREQPAHSP